VRAYIGTHETEAEPGQGVPDEACTDRAPLGLFYGYLLGAAVMVAGGIVALIYGVAAERQSLEDIATPLNAIGRRGTTRSEGAGSPRAT
jgi:hypothetical protein